MGNHLSYNSSRLEGNTYSRLDTLRLVEEGISAKGQVVKRNLHGKDAEQFIERYCTNNDIDSSEKFTAMTMAELSALHAGAIIGLGITETELNDWLDTKSQNTA